MKAVIFSITSQDSLLPLAEKLGAVTTEFRNPIAFREGIELDLNFDFALFDKPYPKLIEYLKSKGVKVHLNEDEFESIEKAVMQKLKKKNDSKKSKSSI